MTKRSETKPHHVSIVPAFSLPLPLCYPSCSARPPTQTDLTHRQSVLVGSVAVPHYPLSAPWPWTSLKLPSRPSSPHPFRTTSILSRLDASSICLGWISCCTPLPPLRARGCQVRHRRFSNHSQTSSLHNPGCHLSSSTSGTCSFTNVYSIWLTRACAAHCWAVSFVFFHARYCSFIHVYNIWLTRVSPSRLEPLLFPTVSAYPSLRLAPRVDIRSFRPLWPPCPSLEAFVIIQPYQRLLASFQKTNYATASTNGSSHRFRQLIVPPSAHPSMSSSSFSMTYFTLRGAPPLQPTATVGT
jgi:hypothetical protein